MEKDFNREEEFLIELLKEKLSEKPSVDFRNSVMMRIEANKASIKPYSPLISKTVWYLLAIAIVLAVGGLYYQSSGMNSSFSDTFEFVNSELLNISFPKIYLSKTMQYAVAFVGLFLLQIPFLKKIMDRQYNSYGGADRSENIF